MQLRKSQEGPAAAAQGEEVRLERSGNSKTPTIISISYSALVGAH